MEKREAKSVIYHVKIVIRQCFNTITCHSKILVPYHLAPDIYNSKYCESLTWTKSKIKDKNIMC